MTEIRVEIDNRSYFGEADQLLKLLVGIDYRLIFILRTTIDPIALPPSTIYDTTEVSSYY